MRKLRLIVLMLLGAAFVAGATASPAASADPAAAQTQVGTIKAPLRFALDVNGSSWPGGQRQLFGIAGSNGDVGFTFPLTCEDDGPCVENGKFVLEVTGGLTGLEDLDIAFYASFSPVISTGTFASRGRGGEEFTIPDGSRFAIVTMFDGANASFRFRAWEPAADKRPAKPKPVALPGTPGIYPNFGFTEDRSDQWAKRLRSKSHVVIALIDTGINPYHVAFKRPEYAVHPSRYIEGYPADTPALGLSQTGGYEDQRRADDGPVWSKVDTKKLYWIPGTNVIGAIHVADAVDAATPPPGRLPTRRIIDDVGHGTGVASVSAGAGSSFAYGQPFGSNPEALIVVIEGLADAAVEWASQQPWIDFISGSYGDPYAIPVGSRHPQFTAPFVLRDGRTACFSAGNGLSRTGVAYDRYSSIRPTSGPSWVVTVGAVSPRNEQDYGWHSIPVDISSYGNHWPAAAPYSNNGEQPFSGTSNATPVTCGVFSKVLLEARKALGDRIEGIHPTGGQRVPAVGPPNVLGGFLGDGILTRLELQDAVFKTARPGRLNPETYPFDPLVVPDTPLYFTMQGYGLANVASGARAIDVVFGRAPLPARPEVDAWVAAIDEIRDAVYPPPSY